MKPVIYRLVQLLLYLISYRFSRFSLHSLVTKFYTIYFSPTLLIINNKPILFIKIIYTKHLFHMLYTVLYILTLNIKNTPSNLKFYYYFLNCVLYSQYTLINLFIILIPLSRLNLYIVLSNDIKSCKVAIYYVNYAVSDNYYNSCSSLAKSKALCTKTFLDTLIPNSIQ